MTTVTSTASGYTYSSSNSSGLDSAALIQVALQQRLAPADRLDLRVEGTQAEIGAYQNLQGLLQDLTATLNPLRNVPGSSSDLEDSFSQLAAYLSSDNGSDPTSFLGVSAAAGAQTGTYELEILQIAKAHKVASDPQSSRDTALGLTGTIGLAVGNGTPVEIDVTAEMSLQDLGAAINAASDETGIRASIVKVSENSYEMILSAEETGQEIALADVDGAVLANLGILTGTGEIKNEVTAAQDAIVILDGTQIVRDSNELDDVLEGVEISLYGAQQGTTITLEIGEDLGAIKEAIVDFVESYNAYRDFVLEHQAVDATGSAVETALLFGDNLLRSVNESLSGIVATGSDNGQSLAEIGITFDPSNHLIVDEATLDAALLDDVDAIQDLFSFQMTAGSSQLRLLDYGMATASGSFQVDITVDGDGNPVSAGVDGDNAAFTVEGRRLIGAEGSPYEGLVLVYTGNTSASIDVTVSRGLADRLYTTADSLSDPLGSQVQDRIDGLRSNVEAYQEQSQDIRERAADYEARLTEYYARMETQIAQSKLMLSQLKLMLGIDDD